jgi:hypothetical protein
MHERNAISALGAVLDALGITWVLMGALAANRYRVAPRLTQDVDLLLGSVGPGVEPLLVALDAGGFRLRWASAEGDLFRLRHAALGPADLIVAGTDYQLTAISRARVEPLDDTRSVKVLTVEDVIIHKLIAARHQDLADVEAIVHAGLALDRDYLDLWLRFWDLEPAWRALTGPARP